MLGHRELSTEDYLGILKRRLWLVLGVSVVFLAIGIGLTFIIPPQFISQTLVIVQQQKVPEDYVKPVVNEDLNGRLASMKEQILSRSRLEPIIERFSLFEGGRRTMDDRVELTRKAIKVAPIPSGLERMPGFYISFKAQTARTAQQVCAEITSLFVAESLSAREQSAEGTTAFLSQQVADAKRTLDEQDSKLAAFERKYLGRLPGQEQSNLGTLQALTTQLDAATQSLNRMQQDETFLDAVVSQQANEVQRPDSPTVTPVETLESQLKALIAQKKELEAVYTPDYPDVVDVTRQIAEKEKEIQAAASAHAPSSSTTPTRTVRADTPQLQQSRAQLRALQLSIASQKQEQARLNQQVKAYQDRIASSPEIEAEFKQVTRDHDTALQFYNALLSKMNESSMATNLERRQEGEQFQVLDAANLPEEPAFPNRRIFAAGGLIGGLCCGVLLAALLEYRDKSLRDEKDILHFTKLPTLASISRVDSLARHSKKRIGRRLLPRTTEL